MHAKNRDLDFFYTNADQFFNKRDELVAIIAGDEPDVIMITEVIPKNQVNPIPLALLHIEGYQIELNFDPSKENLGRSGIRGVAIYTKSELMVNKIDLNVKGLFEDIWLVMKCGTKTLLVGCVYRSPKSDSNTDSSFESAIDTSNLLRKGCTT